MRMLLGFKLRMLFGLCFYAYVIKFQHANAIRIMLLCARHFFEIANDSRLAFMRVLLGLNMRMRLGLCVDAYAIWF